MPSVIGVAAVQDRDLDLVPEPIDSPAEVVDADLVVKLPVADANPNA